MPARLEQNVKVRFPDGVKKVKVLQWQNDGNLTKPKPILELPEGFEVMEATDGTYYAFPKQAEYR